MSRYSAPRRPLAPDTETPPEPPALSAKPASEPLPGAAAAAAAARALRRPFLPLPGRTQPCSSTTGWAAA
eukprot:3368715-Pyramimonas_sp.AAC.1